MARSTFEGVKPRRIPVDPVSQHGSMLRSCLGRFATGVAVVTFDDGSGAHGITVNSFTSVSLSPPLVLVSIARTTRSHDALEGRAFCVNVLGAEHEAVARCFAGSPDNGAAVRFSAGTHAPRLEGAVAHLECLPWRTYDGGDHTLFVGEIVDFTHRDGDLLGYVASRFTTIPEPRLGVEYLI